MTTAMPLQPERQRLKLLYLRLTDSAPLIVAREWGCFEQFGLDVQLQRETSWATLRDKLLAGAADAAAMLAPMPLMLAQALPHCDDRLLTGLVLSCNGNAITLSRTLSEALCLPTTPDAAGAALGRWLHAQPAGARPLKLATVHPFSSHMLQLRHWLERGGIDPNRDLQILILPPEQMVARLQQDEIDGYCVGEPWNTLAVQRGLGRIVTPCNALLPGMPEKVLAVTESWHERYPQTHLALRAALLQACSLLACPVRRREAVTLLAQPQYLDLEPESLAPSLSGELQAQQHEPPSANPDWHQFAHTDSDCGRPSQAQARQLLERCARFAPVSVGAEQAFRDDLYQQALALVPGMPGAQER